MTKENLVILKGNKAIEFEGENLSPNTFYRCLPTEKNEFGAYMVYGHCYDLKTFNEFFEFAHDKIMRDWKQIGLVGENNKPLSKTAFVKKANIHSYDKLRIWFFGGTIGDEKFNYGFYPYIEPKPKNAIECYQNYLDTVNGNMVHFDCKDIQYGNCGIPISYNDLRVR